MNPPLLAVVGPTASGKTGVGILLAETLHGEIISADARQVYRGLDIGTAKPTRSELQRVPHHMIDIVDPDDDFHAGRFVELAEEAIEQIRARGALPILVGGTGLYVRALVRGLDIPVGRDPEIRSELNRRAEEEGSGVLHRELVAVDPESAAVIHPNDAIRIVRALEVFRLSGEPQSALFGRGSGEKHRCLMAGLEPEREKLYRRIEGRFALMIKNGLLEEVRSLLERGYDPGLGCFRSPGYREMIQHLRGEMSLEEAVEKAIRETRRYAKRQFTWFRREDLFRVDPMEEGLEKSVSRIVEWYRAAC